MASSYKYNNFKNLKSEFYPSDNQIKIFFGSEDGYLYGIDTNGQPLNNWPKYIGSDNVNSSPVFADFRISLKIPWPLMKIPASALATGSIFSGR